MLDHPRGPALLDAVNAAMGSYHAARAPLYKPTKIQSIGWLDEQDDIRCVKDLSEQLYRSGEAGVCTAQKNPGTDVSVTQMIRKTTDKSRGVRLGNFVQIRTIIDEELEGVWSGKKQPKEALDLAIKRGNEQLERFEKANK